tara:strand:+ start:2579 stop:2965 length:387 start_codon:yes stop_codon:yes gene_type:complete
MTLNPQDALTAHEREQTCKVIDRLNERAGFSDMSAAALLEAVQVINRKIDKLQATRARTRKAIESYGELSSDLRHAAEMLSAELEGEGDPRWRSSSPEAANAEAQARAEVEKQEAQARGRAKIMERQA